MAWGLSRMEHSIASFDSKENTTTSHSPELDLVLIVGGGTITGVLTGSGSGLTGGGTSGTLNLGLDHRLRGQPTAAMERQLVEVREYRERRHHGHNAGHRLDRGREQRKR